MDCKLNTEKSQKERIQTNMDFKQENENEIQKKLFKKQEIISGMNEKIEQVQKGRGKVK